MRHPDFMSFPSRTRRVPPSKMLSIAGCTTALHSLLKHLTVRNIEGLMKVKSRREKSVVLMKSSWVSMGEINYAKEKGKKDWGEGRRVGEGKKAGGRLGPFASVCSSSLCRGKIRDSGGQESWDPLHLLLLLGLLLGIYIAAMLLGSKSLITETTSTKHRFNSLKILNANTPNFYLIPSLEILGSPIY